MERPPKEFWMITTSVGEELIFHEPRPDTSYNKPSECHLIEYWAYASAVKENERLMAELDDLTAKYDELFIENTELKTCMDLHLKGRRMGKG